MDELTKSKNVNSSLNLLNSLRKKLKDNDSEHQSIFILTQTSFFLKNISNIISLYLPKGVIDSKLIQFLLKRIAESDAQDKSIKISIDVINELFSNDITIGKIQADASNIDSLIDSILIAFKDISNSSKINVVDTVTEDGTVKPLYDDLINSSDLKFFYSDYFLSYGYKFFICIGLLASDSQLIQTKIVDRGGMELIMGNYLIILSIF